MTVRYILIVDIYIIMDFSVTAHRFVCLIGPHPLVLFLLFVVNLPGDIIRGIRIKIIVCEKNGSAVSPQGEIYRAVARMHRILRPSFVLREELSRYRLLAFDKWWNAADVRLVSYKSKFYMCGR